MSMNQFNEKHHGVLSEDMLVILHLNTVHGRVYHSLEFYENGVQELIQEANGTGMDLKELLDKLALIRSIHWKRNMKKWAAYKWG